MRRTLGRVLAGGLGVGVVALLLLGLGVTWPVEVLWLLGTGWARFLGEVVPRMDLHEDAIAEALGVAGALAVGLHLFLRGLWRQVHAGLSEARPWPVRWSLSLLALLVLLFGATMSTVGLAHHVGWLFSSPEPLTRSSWPFAPRLEEEPAEQLCQGIRRLSADGVPDERILAAVLREPSLRPLFEQLEVLPWKGAGGFLVFPRDPLTRARSPGARCGGALREVESVPVEKLPRLLEP